MRKRRHVCSKKLVQPRRGHRQAVAAGCRGLPASRGNYRSRGNNQRRRPLRHLAAGAAAPLHALDRGQIETAFQKPLRVIRVGSSKSPTRPQSPRSRRFSWQGRIDEKGQLETFAALIPHWLRHLARVHDEKLRQRADRPPLQRDDADRSREDGQVDGNTLSDRYLAPNRKTDAGHIAR